MTKLKYSIIDCQKIATKNGGKCISSKYKSIKNKLEWECSVRHRWFASFDVIKNDHWCPFCAGNVKLDYNFVKCEIEKRNGTLLSKSYTTSDTKLEIKCNKDNYIWHPIWDNIKQGQWCPKCSNRPVYNISDCIKFAQNRGGKCLSEKYTNIDDRMEWQCEFGHNWQATFYKIKNLNRWCHKCKNKNQTKLFNVIKEIFPNNIIHFNYRRIDWLKNPKTNKNLELDIYIPELKLAIEYDGKQHFEPVNYGILSNKKANKNYKDIVYRDGVKNNIISDNKNIIKYFIRFNYKESISKEYIIDKLKTNGVFI